MLIEQHKHIRVYIDTHGRYTSKQINNAQKWMHLLECSLFITLQLQSYICCKYVASIYR